MFGKETGELGVKSWRIETKETEGGTLKPRKEGIRFFERSLTIH